MIKGASLLISNVITCPVLGIYIYIKLKLNTNKKQRRRVSNLVFYAQLTITYNHFYQGNEEEEEEEGEEEEQQQQQ